jgi:RNA polymerase sigma factor (sigma-70 family)
MLRAFVRQYIKHEEDLADILQEVSLAVLQTQNRPADPLLFAEWCRTLARHVIAHFRRTRRRRKGLLSELGVARANVSAWSRIPEDRALARELLDAALNGVDEESRRLIVLRYLYEENSTEIARRTQRSAASVRMRLMRLRSSVKRARVRTRFH